MRAFPPAIKESFLLENLIFLFGEHVRALRREILSAL